jgi:hypothetical protein
MRPFHVVALALSFVAAAGTASAKQPRPKKVRATSSKKVATARAQPAPTRIVAPAPEAEPEPAAPAAPEPAPAPSPAPTPLAPDAGPSVAPFASEAPARDSARDADHAAAAAEARERPISVAPLLGIGSGGLRFGAGLRAGYTFESHLYVGAGFMYHFGQSTEVFSIKTSTTTMYPSAEVGYDIRFGRMVVRPYGGLAVLVSTTSIENLDSATTTSPALTPGCALTYDIPKSSIFVGGDGRLVLNLDGGTSLGVFGSAGMRF